MAKNKRKKISTPQKCYDCASKVPTVCFFSNLTLGIFKMTVGALTGSKGLYADGIHSMADVVATTGVIVSQKISAKGKDEDYPYGRGNAEFISCIFVYTLLFIVGSYILVSALIDIMSGDIRTPGILSLFSGIVSVIANTMLYKLGMCAGTRANSPAIIANAQENKADQISSAAVIVGIALSHLGLHFADPLAAIVVGCIILHTAITLGYQAILDLIDTSIPEAKIRLINKQVLKIKQIQKVNYIKTKRIGTHYWVDVEIVLASKLTVVEGAAIGKAVRTTIMKMSDKIEDVFVVKTCVPPVRNKKLMESAENLRLSQA